MTNGKYVDKGFETELPDFDIYEKLRIKYNSPNVVTADSNYQGYFDSNIIEDSTLTSLSKDSSNNLSPVDLSLPSISDVDSVISSNDSSVTVEKSISKDLYEESEPFLNPFPVAEVSSFSSEFTEKPLEKPSNPSTSKFLSSVAGLSIDAELSAEQNIYPSKDLSSSPAPSNESSKSNTSAVAFSAAPIAVAATIATTLAAVDSTTKSEASALDAYLQKAASIQTSNPYTREKSSITESIKSTGSIDGFSRGTPEISSMTSNFSISHQPRVPSYGQQSFSMNQSPSPMLNPMPNYTNGPMNSLSQQPSGMSMIPSGSYSHQAHGSSFMPSNDFGPVQSATGQFMPQSNDFNVMMLKGPSTTPSVIPSKPSKPVIFKSLPENARPPICTKAQNLLNSINSANSMISSMENSYNSSSSVPGRTYSDPTQISPIVGLSAQYSPSNSSISGGSIQGSSYSAGYSSGSGGVNIQNPANFPYNPTTPTMPSPRAEFYGQNTSGQLTPQAPFNNYATVVGNPSMVNGPPSAFYPAPQVPHQMQMQPPPSHPFSPHPAHPNSIYGMQPPQHPPRY